jgi:hypothetical protein
MTGWISADATRHIPEDELHAYLDQALSRSQCVEIECHLAECHRCALERDAVAAVRDRTTALLAGIAPRRVAVAPPFDQLIARYHHRVLVRRSFLVRLGQVGLLAASLAAAVAAGWWSRGAIPAPAEIAPVTRPEQARIERTLTAVGPVQTVERPETPAGAPARREARPSSGTPARVTQVRDARPSAPLALQVTALYGMEEGTDAPLAGLWQSVNWDVASTLTGGHLPRIQGLPVVDVQIQSAASDERPIVVVVQQHPSGSVIRTIEGPVERVNSLVEEGSRRFSASAVTFTPPDYLTTATGEARRGLRILTVTGTMPADSLNALARGIEIKN